MNVVGIGQAGCAIAEKFKQYPQYNIFKIDVEIEGKGCFKLEKRNNPEDYEKHCPNFKTFFKKIKGDVLFITSCGFVSGISLCALEQLHKKKCNINILYIKPDLLLLNETKRLQENVLFGVLQEYARSLLFNRIYVVHNVALESILGGTSVLNYYENLNDLIVSTYHMISVFNNSEPVVDIRSEPNAVARISTIGLLDIKNGEEKLFFDLKHSRNKCYYYAIPQNTLETDEKLFKMIKEQVRHKGNTEDERFKLSYGIFSTDYKENYAYVVVHSSVVQKNEIIA